MILNSITKKLNVFRSRSGGGHKEAETIYYAVSIDEPICIASLYSSGLLDSILTSEELSGLLLRFEKQNYSSAIRLIESRIVSYQVELEYNPSNTRAKHMIDLLKGLRDELVKYKDPARVRIIMLFDNEKTAKHVQSILGRYGCKARLAEFRSNFRLRDRSLRIWVLPASKRFIVKVFAGGLLEERIASAYAASTLGVPIGLSTRVYTKSLCYLPLRERGLGNLHTIIVGPTGRGKTHLLALITLLIYALGLATPWVVDPKGDLCSLLARYIKIDELGGIPCLEAPETVCSKFNGIVIVDEAWRFSNSACLSQIFREGRSRGASAIVASQDPSDIPLFWWSNASNTVLFGSEDSRYIAAASRYSGLDTRHLPLLRKLDVGEAIVRYRHGLTQLVRILPLPTIRLRGSVVEAGELG